MEIQNKSNAKSVGNRSSHLRSKIHLGPQYAMNVVKMVISNLTSPQA